MPQNVLSNLDRRLLGNLAIPRNAADLASQLARDPNVETIDAVVAHNQLERFEGFGWVVRLGEARDFSPGLLAADAQAHLRAIPLADEQAQILERRLRVTHREWRAVGEQWMLSTDGLDKMREPTFEAQRFTTSQTAELIARHHDAILDVNFEGSIFDQEERPGDGKGGGRLHEDVSLAAPHSYWLNPHTGQERPIPRLLPEEYKVWLDAVLADHEGAWGEREARELRKRIPVSGGASGYSDATELLILDPENSKGSAYTETAPWYMALSILAFNDTDTGTTADNASHVPTYTGWGRKSVAAADMNAASSGAAANANAIVFAACTAGSSVIIAFAKTTAATLGRIIKWGDCASTTVSTTQTPPQFAVAAFTTSLD